MKIKFLLLILFFVQSSYSQDWANLNRFKIENSELELPASDKKRVVFIGNSITQQWKELNPDFFVGKSYINRGISGQTTPQMLVRFRADVVNLKPAVVVILAGTNDIAGNTGPSTIDMVADNLMSMAEIARANGIKVILSSILPVYDYPWKPGIEPAETIIKLNGMIREYTEENSMIYLDYFSKMVDDKSGLMAELSPDGVHPNKAGFNVMEPLVEKAIAKALKSR